MGFDQFVPLGGFRLQFGHAGQSGLGFGLHPVQGFPSIAGFAPQGVELGLHALQALPGLSGRLGLFCLFGFRGLGPLVSILGALLCGPKGFLGLFEALLELSGVLRLLAFGLIQVAGGAGMGFLDGSQFAGLGFQAGFQFGGGAAVVLSQPAEALHFPLEVVAFRFEPLGQIAGLLQFREFVVFAGQGFAHVLELDLQILHPGIQEFHASRILGRRSRLGRQEGRDGDRGRR